MNKKVIIAIVIIIVLVAVLLFVLNRKKTGDIQIDYSNPDDVGQTQTQTDELATKLGIPSDYTRINSDAVVSTTAMKAQAVAYTFNEEEGLTYVNVYLENTDEKPFYKDAVCVISLNDANGNMLERFGGVIEEEEDIAKGGTTVIKTQYYGNPTGVAGATIDFENTENVAPTETEEAPTETIDTPAETEETPAE